MTYEEMFAKVKKMFADADVSGIGEHLAYQSMLPERRRGVFTPR